ncbi:hypothetical protein Dimus_035219 [Dionaea muscipula]
MDFFLTKTTLQPLLLLLLVHLPFLLVISSFDPFHHPPAEPPNHRHRYWRYRNHHAAHPPTQPPVHPPSSWPPTHPPPPVKPPTDHPPAPVLHPPPHVGKKTAAVQGVVYCKSCNYTGIDSLLGASPLPGAEVVIKCSKSKTSTLLDERVLTDKNGYFFSVLAPLRGYREAHNCKVFLGEVPPQSPCKNPTNLHGGLVGAVLLPEKPSTVSANLPFALYDVGPFAYEPPKCPKH